MNVDIYHSGKTALPVFPVLVVPAGTVELPPHPKGGTWRLLKSKTMGRGMISLPIEEVEKALSSTGHLIIG